MHPDPEHIPDEELISKVAGGDQSAFNILVQRHEDKIFGLAHRVLADRGDALDATQETLLTVYRQASTFRGDSAFTTWLYRIGMNTSRDLLRKRRRWQREGDDIEGIDPPSSGRIDDQVSQRVDLARALEQLSEDYREPVLLHDVLGVPYEEIARVTRTNIGTIKSRISRGRRKLADLMEPTTSAAASKDVT
ncbi:MAG TPA: sigma-70 family RNA polymerase sigma factor [Actinomycetota bacterium]|nr:sigma-70 family RNA polymerase sigma factor [Actinomycetota bacterium]